MENDTRRYEDVSTLERSWSLQLYKEFYEILRYYRITLDTPLIQLSNSRTRYGSYDALSRTISISVFLIREHGWDVVVEVLKHEIAHALVSKRDLPEESAHGPAFQEACAQLGIAPWARQANIEVDPNTALQAHRQLSIEQERLLRRVEKLLSLASSNQTHEASLAMERARELCTRHQLESFLGGCERQYTYHVIQHGKKVIPAHQAAISSILCTHFYVDCVTRSQYDPLQDDSFKVLELVGTRENVQMAEYVYWFLWNQLPLLWESYRGQKTQPLSRTSQRSFYMGVLNGFHEKLSSQKRSMQQKVQEWGLVVHEKERLSLEKRMEADLKHFVRERFPHLHRGGGNRRELLYDEYTNGHQKGRELNLHRGLTQGHKGAIQLLQSGKG